MFLGGYFFGLEFWY